MTKSVDGLPDMKRLAHVRTMHVHPMTNELIEHSQMLQEYKNSKHFPQIPSVTGGAKPSAAEGTR